MTTTVQELIEQLTQIAQTVGPDAPVLITDGFRAQCYRGHYQVAVWRDELGVECCDIGIGGCDEL